MQYLEVENIATKPVLSQSCELLPGILSVEGVTVGSTT